MAHCHMPNHPDHSAELARLNRIAGQVEGLKKMIEDQRYCPDILTQLRATRSALHAIEANILERHMDGCVRDAVSMSPEEAEKKLAELKEIYRRFSA